MSFGVYFKRLSRTIVNIWRVILRPPRHQPPSMSLKLEMLCLRGWTFKRSRTWNSTFHDKLSPCESEARFDSVDNGAARCAGEAREKAIIRIEFLNRKSCPRVTSLWFSRIWLQRRLLIGMFAGFTIERRGKCGGQLCQRLLSQCPRVRHLIRLRTSTEALSGRIWMIILIRVMKFEIVTNANVVPTVNVFGPRMWTIRASKNERETGLAAASTNARRTMRIFHFFAS